MVCNMVQEAALSAVRTVVEAVAVAPRSGLTALPPAAYGGGLVSLAASLGAAGHALLPLLLLLVPEFCVELLTAAQPEQLQMAAQQALRRLAGCSDLPLRQQPPDWLRLHPLLERAHLPVMPLTMRRCWGRCSCCTRVGCRQSWGQTTRRWAPKVCWHLLPAPTPQPLFPPNLAAFLPHCRPTL